MNSTEKGDNRQPIINVDEEHRQIQVQNPKADDLEGGKQFTFDAVFGPNSQQEAVFRAVALPIIDSVMSGYNGTIFAYGQTGTGKTHTMEGQPGSDIAGIIPRAFIHIFNSIKEAGSTNYMVRVSFLEIYNEQVRDLLAQQNAASNAVPQALQLRETPDKAVYVDDLRAVPVENVAEMMKLLEVRGLL